MPRDGAGVYSRPPGTDAVTDTTIDSAKYNTNVADVETDLNTPRPIVAGGTAATSADNALTSLSAEKAKQVVTNWDATTWRAGSFYAATSATGAAPVAGHAFAGIAYYANATDFVNKAVDLTVPANPIEYIRVMAAGVWSPWTVIGGSAVVPTNAGYFSWVSATQVALRPYNSDLIRINGAIFQMPSGGVSAANTSIFLNGVAGQNLAASTLYYVYLFNNAGTLTIDFSATVPVSSATVGNTGTMVKTGDDTRTLIGMVYTNATSQFVASDVISWFNKKARHVTNQGGWTNAAGQLPVEFCTWADEAISYHVNLLESNNTAFGVAQSIITIDGANQPQVIYLMVPTASGTATGSMSATRLLAAGRHVVAQTLTITGGVTASNGETSVLFRG